MSDITAGDLAVFLEANPGPHRIGRYVVEHIGRFDLSDGWLSSVSDTQDGPEPGYESRYAKTQEHINTMTRPANPADSTQEEK